MLLLASVLPAQQRGSIRVVVTDRDSATPVAEAEITIAELGTKTLTNAQGTFVFNEIPAGTYTLIFAKEGYISQIKTDVAVVERKLIEINIALAGDIVVGEELIVEDTLLELDTGSEEVLLDLRLESPSLLDSISSDLISRAGASDAAGAVRLIVGASVQDGKTAVVRGLPDRYVSSQVNGVRLPSADEDKRAVELDQFPAAAIESVQVSKTFTPDQQGDASGGAVNLRLKSIPSEPFFAKFSGQASHNTQVTGRNRFLTYEGGGVRFLGRGKDDRPIQVDNLGGNWDGAVGVSRGDAPLDFKGSGAVGGKHDIGGDLRIGGYASVFYERDSSFYDRGIDDTYWVDSPGEPMSPKTSQGAPVQGTFVTSLYDVTQGKQSVQWGTLATIGLETDSHTLNLTHLRTLTAEDTATLAEDTRGKAYYFPGHDPDNPTTPGHLDPGAAPYLRLETLAYSERSTGTIQLSGRHRMPFDSFRTTSEPELDWIVAKSTADSAEPDKRQFGSTWAAGLHGPFKPDANFLLGNLQRIYEAIEEDSTQYATNFKVPFSQWSDTEGYLKAGVFRDRVRRNFNQDTFSNFRDPSGGFSGPWQQYWSSAFPFAQHPITESQFDVDYRATQKIAAWYGMADIPLWSSLHLIGGVRFESTRIGVTNDAEPSATWFPPGTTAPDPLDPGEADVSFRQHDALPSIGLVYNPIEDITLRASYNETVARQTFKELTPILQQEFLGGPIFIGNPALKMSALENYDLRADYTPYEGGLFSISWFRKNIADPIEYVQRLTSVFDFTTAVNYPKGRLSGVELETRQDLGQLWSPLAGLRPGANATFISSEAFLPAEDAAAFSLPNIQAPMASRDMTGAPEHLYNLFFTYDLADWGTQLGLFYTVQGDTLVAGAGQDNGNFIPNVYALDYGTLNASVFQKLGQYVTLQLAGKNLTNPRIDEVYRSPYIGNDVTKTSFRTGVEYSISLGGEFRF